MGDMDKKGHSGDDLLKWIVIGSTVVVVGIIGFFIFKESAANPQSPQNTSTEGFEKVPDLGRLHVDDGTEITYNSNPPTSGSHSVEWTKPGIYDEVIPDGKLIHSLEHGYIIVSYNCGNQEGAPATDEENEATASGEQGVTPLDETACTALKDTLTEIIQEKGMSRLIMVPRPTLDARIALTAWTWLHKMEQPDKTTIHRFIDAFRNQGPEKTME